MNSGPIAMFVGGGLAPAASAAAKQAGIHIQMVPSYPSEAVLVDEIERVRPMAIIMRAGTITGKAIRAALPELRLIAKHGVGVDTIDVVAATDAGIPVSITNGANALSVAEHALALILSVARSIPQLDSRIRHGHWDKPSVTGIELSGKTLGLVGFGMIARLLADLTQPFKMPVLIYDPHIRGDLPNPRFNRVASLEDLLRRSDVVSLHCPLTPETRNIIGRDQLALLGSKSIIVNTARGGLIEEGALAEALKANGLAGAGLDTFAGEPLAPDSPLLTAPNLVLSPHVGASTHEAKVRVGMMVIQQVIDVIAGKIPEDYMLVNPGVRAAA